MTENEAKTKWCPFVRITQPTDTYHAMTNREQPLVRDTPENTVSRCIASACMAWRQRLQGWENCGSGQMPIYSTTDGECGIPRADMAIR